MTLIWQMAWRYFRGKRGANIVPVLSRISMLAIAVASCAMIVLFSIFNGFESLIKDLYKAFYPEIKVTPATGKFFALSDTDVTHLKNIRGVAVITKVIEDNVLLNANDEQQVATLKGIDKHFASVNNIRPYIYTGSDRVSDNPQATALIGLQMANRLGIDINNVFSRLSLYYPNTETENATLSPQTAFQNLQLKPEGIFRIQDEFDGKYILAPIARVQELFMQPGKYSSIEISLAEGADNDDVKTSIERTLGNSYRVATRYEQNRTLYLVMTSEKWAVYGILVLVLLIASFNMIGALTMLVIEKQKDIAILKAMGAADRTIRRIFISEGILWAATGGIFGILLGAFFCIGQSRYHWIKLKGAFIIDAYPVAMQIKDFILVFVTVLFVGLVAAWFPSRRSAKAQDPSLKSA